MPRLRDIPAPLAINMWDFSWLLRQYPGGGFEDLDAALDGLVERGYNALRIDCFPHMVAAAPDGAQVERFRCPPVRFGHVLWGNAWTVTINPRQALLSLLEKCRARGIYIGLSTWFSSDESKRNEREQGAQEFIRVWDETLHFLDDHDALSNVVYVDLLNEYPLWHGFTWLTKMLETMSEPALPERMFNQQQTAFYRTFLNDCLAALKSRWPQLDFLASQTHNFWEDDADMDYARFDLLDIHLWFVHHPFLGKESGYNAEIHPLQRDEQWEVVYARMRAYWTEDRAECIRWMEEKMARMAAVAAKWQIPLGNTEGWGAILWDDHPALDWAFIKEAGEVCARLGAKYGYRFNCTSNFNHPYFGLWQDIAWHQRVTAIIRNGGG